MLMKLIIRNNVLQKPSQPTAQNLMHHTFTLQNKMHIVNNSVIVFFFFFLNQCWETERDFHIQCLKSLGDSEIEKE